MIVAERGLGAGDDRLKQHIEIVNTANLERDIEDGGEPGGLPVLADGSGSVRRQCRTGQRYIA